MARRWCPDGGGQVRDAGVVTDVESGLRDPAGKVIEIVESLSSVQLFLRSREPFHFAAKLQFLESAAIVCHAAGKWMDDREVGLR